VQQAYAPVGEDLRRQLLVQLLRRAHVLERLRLLDERAYNVRLPPGVELASHLIVGLVALGQANEPGLDRLASRRKLVDDRDLQVSVEG
jgi:hypothetical protein